MPRRFARFIALALMCAWPAGPAFAGAEIGDPAPPLKIKTWVKGEKIDLNKDASKRVHLIEFWATWCPPCKASIPLLNHYQKKFGKDLLIVGVTDPDTDRNTPSMIKDFVKGQGPQMDYTVAMDDRGATSDAYMGAEVLGIPQAYVVNRDGKIAWAGSPLDPALDKVLTDVVAGKHDITTAKAQVSREQDIERRFAVLDRAYQMGKIDEVWGGLLEITEIDPANSMAMELLASMYVSDPDRRSSIRSWVEEHINRNASNSNAMAVLALTLCRIDDFTLRMPDLMLRAGKAAYEASKGEDFRAMQVYARTQYEIGALDKAIELQGRVVTLADADEKEEARKILDFYETCKKLQAQ